MPAYDQNLLYPNPEIFSDRYWREVELCFRHYESLLKDDNMFGGYGIRIPDNVAKELFPSILSFDEFIKDYIKNPLKYKLLRALEEKLMEYNFTADDVRKLNDKAGVGLTWCKKALIAANGDHDKAFQWLKENYTFPKCILVRGEYHNV